MTLSLRDHFWIIPYLCGTYTLINKKKKHWTTKNCTLVSETGPDHLPDLGWPSLHIFITKLNNILHSKASISCTLSFQTIVLGLIHCHFPVTSIIHHQHVNIIVHCINSLLSDIFNYSVVFVQRWSWSLIKGFTLIRYRMIFQNQE